jgi:hypothetical protein
VNNVILIKNAYDIDDNDPKLIYMKDFMEFEMEIEIAHFNLDDN